MDRNTRQRVSGALLTVTLVFALLAVYYALTMGTVATKAFTQSFVFAIALAGATLGVRFWPDRRGHDVPGFAVPISAAAHGQPPVVMAEILTVPHSHVPTGGLAERLQAHENPFAERPLAMNDLVPTHGAPGPRRHKVSPVVAARAHRRSARGRAAAADPEPTLFVAAEAASPDDADPGAPFLVAAVGPPLPPPVVLAKLGTPADPPGIEIEPAAAPPYLSPEVAPTPGSNGSTPVVAPSDAAPVGAMAQPNLPVAPVPPAPDSLPGAASPTDAAPRPPTAPLSPDEMFRPDPSAPRELLLELASYWHTRYTLERDLAAKQQAAKSAQDAETAGQDEEEGSKRISST